jgi:hypothetical protein
MPFTHESAVIARSRKGSLHRAAFWRAQGFPNLVKARATYLANRRKAWAEAAVQAEPRKRSRNLPL